MPGPLKRSSRQVGDCDMSCRAVAPHFRCRTDGQRLPAGTGVSLVVPSVARWLCPSYLEVVAQHAKRATFVPSSEEAVATRAIDCTRRRPVPSVPFPFHHRLRPVPTDASPTLHVRIPSLQSFTPDGSQSVWTLYSPVSPTPSRLREPGLCPEHVDMTAIASMPQSWRRLFFLIPIAVASILLLSSFNHSLRTRLYVSDDYTYSPPLFKLPSCQR